MHGAVKRTGFLVRSCTELKDAGAGDGTDFAFVSNHDMLSNEIASLFALTLKTYELPRAICRLQRMLDRD